MQTKTQSLIEATVNSVSGYLLAVLTQVLLFPLFGIHIPLGQNFLLAFIFTVISIARSYVVRRLFNRWHNASKRTS